MMELVVPPELEELIVCSCCNQSFNDTDAVPKLLSCRHHFCLKCVNSILLKSGELYCVHCWKRTELPAPDMKTESLPTYNAILYLAQNLGMLNTKPKAPDKSNNAGGGGGGTNGGSGSGSTGGGGGVGILSSAASVSGPSSSAVAVAAASIQPNNKITKGENCHTHAMPNGLWCMQCHTMICRACAGGDEHRSHTVKSQAEAKETMRCDIANEVMNMEKTQNDAQHLAFRERDFLLKILEAVTALKTQIETELINHVPTLEVTEMREILAKAKAYVTILEHQTPTEVYRMYVAVRLEKQMMQSKVEEMHLQCKLDDLIRQYTALFDFELIKQALANLQSGESAAMVAMNGVGHHNQILLLANYCISHLYSRHILTHKHAPAHLMNVSTNGNGHYVNATISQMLSGVSPREAKTFAEIAGSPKTINNNNNNYLDDSLTGHVSSVIRHSAANSSYMSDNGVGLPLTIMQHLQHSTQQQQQQQQQHQQQQQQQQQHQQQQLTVATSLMQSPQTSVAAAAAIIACNPTVHVYPIYYFNIEINGSPCGRILIEVRNDVAPKMAKNFGALVTGELGFGYKGCHIFQCWENESIITGDFELNNGRGGRSVFEDGFFMPDDTKILAIRGSVGMRRSQKRHDNMGLVGSQFRIILREMRGFTGIFAFVVEGLELVEKISQTGDSAGKPQSNVIIVNCGKLQ